MAQRKEEQLESAFNSLVERAEAFQLASADAEDSLRSGDLERIHGARRALDVKWQMVRDAQRRFETAIESSQDEGLKSQWQDAFEARFPSTKETAWLGEKEGQQDASTPFFDEVEITYENQHQQLREASIGGDLLNFVNARRIIIERLVDQLDLKSDPIYASIGIGKSATSYNNWGSILLGNMHTELEEIALLDQLNFKDSTGARTSAATELKKKVEAATGENAAELQSLFRQLNELEQFYTPLVHAYKQVRDLQKEQSEAPEMTASEMRGFQHDRYSQLRLKIQELGGLAKDATPLDDLRELLSDENKEQIKKYESEVEKIDTKLKEVRKQLEDASAGKKPTENARFKIQLLENARLYRLVKQLEAQRVEQVTLAKELSPEIAEQLKNQGKYNQVSHEKNIISNSRERTSKRVQKLISKNREAKGIVSRAMRVLSKSQLKRTKAKDKKYQRQFRIELLRKRLQGHLSEFESPGRVQPTLDADIGQKTRSAVLAQIEVERLETEQSITGELFQQELDLTPEEAAALQTEAMIEEKEKMRDDEAILSSDRLSAAFEVFDGRRAMLLDALTNAQNLDIENTLNEIRPLQGTANKLKSQLREVNYELEELKANQENDDTKLPEEDYQEQREALIKKIADIGKQQVNVHNKLNELRRPLRSARDQLKQARDALGEPETKFLARLEACKDPEQFDTYFRKYHSENLHGVLNAPLVDEKLVVLQRGLGEKRRVAFFGALSEDAAKEEHVRLEAAQETKLNPEKSAIRKMFAVRENYRGAAVVPPSDVKVVQTEKQRPRFKEGDKLVRATASGRHINVGFNADPELRQGVTKSFELMYLAYREQGKLHSQLMSREFANMSDSEQQTLIGRYQEQVANLFIAKGEYDRLLVKCDQTPDNKTISDHYREEFAYAFPRGFDMTDMLEDGVQQMRDAKRKFDQASEALQKAERSADKLARLGDVERQGRLYECREQAFKGVVAIARQRSVSGAEELANTYEKQAEEVSETNVEERLALVREENRDMLVLQENFAQLQEAERNFNDEFERMDRLGELSHDELQELAQEFDLDPSSPYLLMNLNNEMGKRLGNRLISMELAANLFAKEINDLRGEAQELGGAEAQEKKEKYEKLDADFNRFVEAVPDPSEITSELKGRLAEEYGLDVDANDFMDQLANQMRYTAQRMEQSRDDAKEAFEEVRADLERADDLDALATRLEAQYLEAFPKQAFAQEGGREVDYFALRSIEARELIARPTLISQAGSKLVDSAELLAELDEMVVEPEPGEAVAPDRVRGEVVAPARAEVVAVLRSVAEENLEAEIRDADPVAARELGDYVEQESVAAEATQNTRLQNLLLAAQSVLAGKKVSEALSELKAANSVIDQAPASSEKSGRKGFFDIIRERAGKAQGIVVKGVKGVRKQVKWKGETYLLKQALKKAQSALKQATENYERCVEVIGAEIALNQIDLGEKSPDAGRSQRIIDRAFTQMLDARSTYDQVFDQLQGHPSQPNMEPIKERFETEFPPRMVDGSDNMADYMADSYQGYQNIMTALKVDQPEISSQELPEAVQTDLQNIELPRTEPPSP